MKFNGQEMIAVEQGPGCKVPWGACHPVGDACDVWLASRGIVEPSMLDFINGDARRGQRERDARGRFVCGA
jgi:hypothetical protein